MMILGSLCVYRMNMELISFWRHPFNPDEPILAGADDAASPRGANSAERSPSHRWFSDDTANGGERQIAHPRFWPSRVGHGTSAMPVVRSGYSTTIVPFMVAWNSQK